MSRITLIDSDIKGRNVNSIFLPGTQKHENYRIGQARGAGAGAVATAGGGSWRAAKRNVMTERCL